VRLKGFTGLSALVDGIMFQFLTGAIKRDV
jgi:hypothetical protein